MFTFLKKTTLAAVAATSFAVIGGTSEAATTNLTNDIIDNGVYDIFDGPFAFGVFFENADGPSVYNFDFFNSSATDATVGVAVGTVLQFASRFIGGVTAAWTHGDSVHLVAAFGGAAHDSRTQGFAIFTDLSAGETDTLTLTFGNPQGTGQPGLQMNVAAISAIPVPAAGFLLLGALGGIAALRRRKTV